VTDPADSVEREARDAYDSAARRSLVTVRELHSPRELEDARRLCDAVWPTVGGGSQVTANMLRAIEHAGGYVVGAYDRDGEPVGTALGFLGRHRDAAGAWEAHLHSHMAAVVPAMRDRSVGTALKLHQRWWAVRHDIPVVTWTFDPLVRRNARVNLVKLGAEVAAYLPDFYGEMDDEVNVGDPTDRLLAWWRVSSPRARDAAAGRLAAASGAALRESGAVDLVLVGAAGPTPVDPAPGGDVLLVALPEDIVVVRSTDPDLAKRWRLVVREVMHHALSRHHRVDGITDDGAYVLRRKED
jgi:predicted GNAT superfamily acetyltransferase